MVSAWNEQAARYLLATTMCPRCDAELGIALICPVCAADLRGAGGRLVWRASQLAADAVLERERLIAALPTAQAASTAIAPGVVATASASASATAAGVTVGAPSVAPAMRADAAPAAESQVSVQSVLAVAGAGLFAIAAIVFTFLNPDIDFATRTTVIAIVTALFLGGAWMLRRRGVRFSAEAIGALGMVFLALDVWAFSEGAPAAVSGWVFAAVGTLVASLAMLVIAWIARIRTWLWAALVGLAVVPAFFGYSGDVWSATWGHVGVVAVALAGHEVVRRAAGRFESDLRADRVTLAVLQVVATVVVLGQLLFLLVTVAWSQTPADVLARVAILAVLAALATLSTRTAIPRFWSFTAGALGATALVVLPLAAPSLDLVWLPTLMPLAAAIGVAATGLVGTRGLLRARPVQAGALVVALAVTMPAAMIALGTLLGILMEFVVAIRTPAIEPGGFGLGAEAELAGVLGLFATALGLAALAAAARRMSAPALRGGFPVGMLGLALWVGALGALAAIGWSGIVPLAQAGIGIASALAACAAVLVPPSRFTRARASIRAPFIAFAHLALVEAAFITWADAAITVPVGAVIVAAALVLAGTTPAGARAVYVAAAYAYALVLFATALDRMTILDTIAVLCLTTTLAALSALAATLVRQVGARAWYAILIVTAVPFLIGVASVLSERSGWTALSTGVTFLLALALVLTRRPGLNRLVRSAAAAMLVPALAVVVVCLGAAFLDVSGSPVVLPVIAVIVAVVLPSTKFIEAALVAHGLGAVDAASVRIWIEISSLVTAAIAVVLALVRDAAGLGTAIAVLVILGLGSAATRVFAGRRYGWWLAGASWTGALWCVWAMLGVEVVEPYTLPPSLAAMIAAAILVARGGGGAGLFTSGLACALLPSLVILAAWGPGDVVAWRTIALLAASVVLLALGWLLTRREPVSGAGAGTGIRMLRAPLLAGALVAAAAGPVQAVRYGLERDPLALADPDLVMLPVLGLTLASVVLAVAAAWLLCRGARALTEPTPLDRWLLGSRWLYAPALVYLVVGPIAAIRRDWFAIWTLWGLMALLLALALVMVAGARTTKPVLPPFWFIYALAWVTGVTGWSERDLRVEVFALPLGLAVLAAGIIALRPGSLPTPATLNSWPIGFRGSWRLLAPGIVLTFLPSVLATGTDPQLYRPILVIALALVAILVGSSRKLAAPFILGLAVLPIENIMVFSAQVDRAVGAMPWWITLSTAGAVLLAIAVGSERRTNQGKGVAARLRELE